LQYQFGSFTFTELMEIKEMNTRKRTLGLGTSAVALFALSGAGLAQDAPEQPHENQAVQSAEQLTNARPAKSEADAMQLTAAFGVSELDDIEDWKVTNAGEELGEIDRIAVDRATGELVAVVGLAGVVGLNMKEVAIPLQNLQKAGEETLSTDASKEELQRRRDIDPWDGEYADID
jgi:hypothetical protein